MNLGLKTMPTVAVIGLGHIGLPTAAILARAGLDVVGVDVTPERVEAVNRGELPFVEGGPGGGGRRPGLGRSPASPG